MSKELHDALDNCLTLIQKGVDPDQVLSLYPHLADELREPLTTAAMLTRSGDSEPDLQTIRSSRKKILSQMQGQPSSRHRLAIPWPRLRPAWALGLVISVLALSSILTVSAQALPGGALYPIKRAIERLRYALTLSPQSLLDLEAELRRERIGEAQALIENGLHSSVDLQGQVDRIEGSILFVDGLPIQTPPDWEGLNRVGPGDWVAIEGSIEQGAVQASSVEHIPPTWTGRIESMQGSDWMVDGRSITIDSAAAGEQSFDVGDLVAVEISPNPDGQWQALSIVRLEGDTLAEVLADLAQEENLRVAQWTGPIISIHPTWIQIGQSTVRTGEWTEIESNIVPGDWVTVDARWDGDWWALEIKTIDTQDFDVPPLREIQRQDDEDSETDDSELDQSAPEEDSHEQETDEEEEEHEQEQDD